jgi:hypothetical protein
MTGEFPRGHKRKRESDDDQEPVITEDISRVILRAHTADIHKTSYGQFTNITTKLFTKPKFMTASKVSHNINLFAHA